MSVDDVSARDVLLARAAVRRRLSNDPDTIAMAGEIEALVDLLDAVDWALKHGFEGAGEYGNDAEAYDRIKAARDALVAAVEGNAE